MGYGMNVQLSVHGPNNITELTSLHRWLKAKGGELRTAGITMEQTVETPQRPDTMGGTFEIVQFAFDAVAQYGALAIAIASWRRAYPSRCSFTLERGDTKITLTEVELRDMSTVLRALEELSEEDDPEEEGE